MTSVGRRKGEPPAKAANRAQLPEVLANRPSAIQQLFERDYEWAANRHPDPRIRADIKKGGRKYAAAMWVALYDTLYGRPRRRKAPGECHKPECPCSSHKRNRLPAERSNGAVAVLAGAIDRHGPEYA